MLTRTPYWHNLLLQRPRPSELKVNELGLTEYTKHDRDDHRARIQRPSGNERQSRNDGGQRAPVLQQLHGFQQCNPHDCNRHLAQHKLISRDASEIPACCEMRPYVPCVAHRLGSKQYPSHARQQKRARYHRQASRPSSFVHTDQTKGPITHIFAEAPDNQINRVEESPKDVRPVRAMPEATDTKCNKEARKVTPFAKAAAAHRNVHVIAEPSRKRDVPTSPEFGDRRRMVWLIEILHQLEAEHARRAYCDIRVTREVAIDLIGEKDCCERQLQTIEVPRTGIHVIYVQSQSVGNHELFEKAPRHPLQPCGHPCVVEVVAFIELVKQVLRSLDRTRYELRKEHHVCGVSHQVGFGFLFTAINFDYVAQALERVKREAYRQNDLDGGSGQPPSKQPRKTDDIAGEEIEIFEHEKDEAGREHAACKQARAGASGRPLKIKSCRVIDGDRQRQDKDVGRDKGHIENATGREQIRCLEPLRKQEINCRNDRKKYREL